MLTMSHAPHWQRTLRAADTCPVGEYFDDDENRCVSMCSTGTIFNPETMLCVPPPIMDPATAKSEPIYKKPWFYGGVAAAAVLGIGIGILVAK